MRVTIPLLAVLMIGPLSRAEERRPAKEPRYRSGQPTYGLLAFGAGDGFRVWVVQDGDKLYVDQNGTGDLTEPGKVVRPLPSGNLDEGDGTTKVSFYLEALREPGGKKHTRLLLTRITGDRPGSGRQADGTLRPGRHAGLQG